MADEDNDQGTVAGGDGGGSGTPKALLILLVVNVVVMLGVIGVLMMDKQKQDAAQSIDKIAEGSAEGHGAAGEGGEAGEGEAAVKASDMRFYGVGDFTANLSGPGTGHYIKVSVNLKLDQLLSEHEVKKRQPQIRDKIIFILNSKSPKDLQASDGRSFLKEEIKAAINGLLDTGKVEAVYFQSFIFE